MKIRPAISTLACMGLLHAVGIAAPTADQMQALVKSRPELDEILWKDPARGAPLKVRIIQATGQTLTVEKTLPAGLTVRTIPMAELAGVEISFTPRELLLHASPAVAAIPPLRVYWETRQATMRLAGSNASETGLALAKSLRLSGEPTALEEAGVILDQIRSQETVKSRIELARGEQATLDLARIMKSGNGVEAGKLAWKITESEGNPDGMLLATEFLAEQNFEELRKIEEENPRWMEDDEIRSVREKLHHLALDFSLYPSLFLGTREAEAAAGLKMAAEIHLFTDGNLLAKNVLEDLAALYPESGAAKDTAAMLTRLKQADAAGKITEPVSPPAGKTPASSPGSPDSNKRYNIFGD